MPPCTVPIGFVCSSTASIFIVHSPSSAETISIPSSSATGGGIFIELTTPRPSG